MRRSILASVVLLLAAAPAFAAFDKAEVKCRKTIAGSTTKLVDKALKAVATCHKRRDTGKIAESTDCNDFTSPAVDPKGKVAAAELKLMTDVAAKCGTLDADVRSRYVSCPTPCRGLAGVGNPLASYGEVAECLACGAKSFVAAEVRAKLGGPPVAPLGDDDRHCHVGIGKTLRTFDVAILKTLTKCQAAADGAGNNDTAGCTASTDPSGGITRAQEKADVALTKACGAADLTRVSSCSSISLDALKTCLGVPRGGFGGGSTLFEAFYDLAPSRGGVEGSVQLDLPTQEGALIALPGITVSLAVGVTPPIATAVSDVRGRFLFSSVPLGTYDLCWTAPGYVAGCLADPVTVTDDMVSPHPIAVAPSVALPGNGVLRGRALLADGTPCAYDDRFFGVAQNGTVTVTDELTGSVLSEAPTNSNGEFVAAGVSQTNVTLHAACAGASVDVTMPQPLDLSGFDRIDLTWPNHSPDTNDLQATVNGSPAGVVQPGDTIDVSALVHDDDANPLTYEWRTDDASGSVVVNGATATWTVPSREGLHDLYFSAHDDFGGFSAAKLVVGCNALPYILNAKDQATQSGLPPWDGYPTSIFLTRAVGVAGAAEACTYYNLVDPACADLDCNGTPDPNGYSVPCKRTTLGGWWEVNGFSPFDGSGGDVVRTWYENHNDLGFGREMNCRKAANGNVACFVANFGEGDQNPNNANLAYQGNPNCAGETVTMEYSPVELYEGVGPLVKFFVYKGRKPGSPRVASADFDGFGQKFVPGVCQNCHGGLTALTGYVLAPFQFGHGMFGWLDLIAAYLQRANKLFEMKSGLFPSSFLAFDLPTFNYPTALPQAAQEAQFKALNAHVKATNPRPGIVELIDGWYAGNSPTQITSFIPPAWTGFLFRTDLYTKVVKPACRTCHVAAWASRDFTTPFFFEESNFYYSFYNVCGPTTKAMPHAFMTYKNFWQGGTGPAYLAVQPQTYNQSCQ